MDQAAAAFVPQGVHGGTRGTSRELLAGWVDFAADTDFFHLSPRRPYASTLPFCYGSMIFDVARALILCHMFKRAHLFPCDDGVAFAGQLTAIGADQHRDLGYAFRQMYGVA